MARIKHFSNFKRPALLAAILTALSPAAAQATAGRVDFAIGDVRAVNAAGSERKLTRGERILSGDTIKTTAGRAHVRFTDGSYVSLKPNTDFRIDEYEFDNGASNKERGFFSLLRGGLRTLTGLLGKRNSNAYQMRTPVATIGIRGTHYALDVDSEGGETASVTNFLDSGNITLAYNPKVLMFPGMRATMSRVGDAVLVTFEDPQTGRTGVYQLMPSANEGAAPELALVSGDGFEFNPGVAEELASVPLNEIT